jgi:aspartate racemase
MTSQLRAGDSTDCLLEIPASGPIDEEAAEEAAVVGMHLDGSRPPLFLIRSWSNELGSHRRLACHLGEAQPVYSVGPPSAERPEDIPTTAEAWTDLCLERLLSIPHRDSYLLGGWSFGGVLALEVGERLVASGRRVDLVVMLDTRLPRSYPHTPPGKRKRTKLSKLARRLSQYAALETRPERRAFLHYRFQRRLIKWGKKLRKLGRRAWPGAVPEAAHGPPAEEVVLAPHEKAEMLRTRALRIAYLKYQKRRSSIPVAQFWTEHSRERAGDATLGWSVLTLGELASVPIPGMHYSMFEEPHVGVLAERIRRSLRRVQEDSGAIRRVAPS